MINKSTIAIGYYYGFRSTSTTDVILRSYVDYANVPTIADHFGHAFNFTSDFGNSGYYIEAQASSTPSDASNSVAFGSPMFSVIQLV